MGSTIRFSGLASGLDTDSLVEAMTLNYKNKVDNSTSNKKLLEFKRDVYKDISTSISNFHRKFAGKLRLEGTFGGVTSTNSNTSLVTVNGGSTSGNHVISEVTKLAKYATVQTTTTGKTNDTLLGDMLDFNGSNEIKMTIDDGGTPAEVVLTKDMKLSDLAYKMNLATNNTNISYDNTAKAFFVSSKNTGSSAKISISVDNGVDVMGSLGLGSGNSVTTSGSDASLKYNGIEMTSESNTVTVNGMSFTLNGLTNGETVNIISKQDTASIQTTIEGFVEEYNNLLSKLTKLVGSTKSSDYKPLTDEQKEDMSEDEIKNWNEKLTSSLMAGDPTLRTIVSELRETMSTILPNVGGLADIGISSLGWQDKGALYIDSTKFTKAIQETPEKVIEIFAGKDGREGIADKLYSKLDTHFKNISGVKTSISVFSDTKLDSDIKSEIENNRKLQEKLEDMEDAYYKKFTAMEKMIQQLNTQSSWLTSQTTS